MGEWLDGYDFAYAGRDTINIGITTFNKMAPGLIKMHQMK